MSDLKEEKHRLLKSWRKWLQISISALKREFKRKRWRRERAIGRSSCSKGQSAKERGTERRRERVREIEKKRYVER